mgnify:FL=1
MTLIGDRLTYPPAQRALFVPERTAAARQERLMAAMDRVRHRFGDDALAMGRMLTT